MFRSVGRHVGSRQSASKQINSKERLIISISTCVYHTFIATISVTQFSGASYRHKRECFRPYEGHYPYRGYCTPLESQLKLKVDFQSVFYNQTFGLFTGLFVKIMSPDSL